MTNAGEQGDVRVELPPDLTAAGEARSVAKRILPGWRLAGLLDPVLLVVSELVGNAVRHGHPPVGLRLRKVGRGVRVDVHDESSAVQPCAPGLAGADAESGRGLFLVDAVSTDTGVEQIEGDGKLVWAQVEPDAHDG